MAEPRLESISAVTFIVREMERAVAFYEALGFERVHGGPGERFTTFRVGDARQWLNLSGGERRDGAGGWGRVIFYVSDVDAMHARAESAGLQPQFAPRDAPWGERYFHLTDPDGNELSFARPLPHRRDPDERA